ENGIGFNTLHGLLSKPVRLSTTNSDDGSYEDVTTISSPATSQGGWGATGTYITSSVEPVPLESDALPVLASAAFMAGGMWWKRKRAQAKVPELVAHKDHLKV
ncbi:hypothetical protein, partial [Cylindrospermopsis raciborskii]|uniref:hypothetical protein n=1 Tax=Cylindrospermopsis raciborskii TaxID=77022 RepID=UPI0038D1B65A